MSALRKDDPRSPLRKIIIIYTVTTIAAILLAGSYNYYHSLQTGLTDEKRHMLTVSHRIKEEIDLILHRIKEDLRVVASLPQFSSLENTDQIRANLPGIPADLEEEKRLIMQDLLRHTSLSQSFILLPDGRFYLIQPFSEKYRWKTMADLVDRPFFQKVKLSNEAVFSDSLLGPDNEPAIIAMIPLLDRNYKVLGYLGGICHLHDLSRIIEETELKGFIQAFMVDRRGNLIAHPEKRITASLQAEFRQEALVLNFLQYYEDYNGNALGKSECRGIDYRREEGDDWLTSICRLDNGWGLILSRDKKRALSHLCPTILRTTLFIALLFLLIKSIGIFFVRSVGVKWRNSQKALAESRRRFKELVDLLPVLVCELDREGYITYANRAALTQTDYKEEDIGKRYHILQLFAPEDKERAKNNIARVLTGGESVGHDYFMIDRLGNPFPVLVYSRPIRQNGEIVGLRGVAVDITDLKNTENLLRRSEERFRLLYNNSPLPQQSLNREGVIVEINQAWLDTLGYTYQEAVNRPFMDFLTPESKAAFLANFPIFKKEGRCEGREYNLVKKDGSVILTSLNGRGAYDYSGRFIKTLCTFRDITEERRTELEKKRYQEGLEKLDYWVKELLAVNADLDKFYNVVCMGLLDMMNADSALMPLIDHSEKSCTYVAAAGKNTDFFKGRISSLEESILCHWIFTHKESLQLTDFGQGRADREIVEKLGATTGILNPMYYDDEIIGGLSVFRREIPYDHIDENLLNLFTHRVSALLANHNLLLGLEEMVAERTRELEMTHKQLLQAEKLSAIGSLSASIAHEFNNPLQGIMSTIRGIKRRVLLEKEDAELVDMSINECERLKALISSLQEFNRPTSGKHVQVDLHDILDHVLLLSKKDHENRGIKIETNYDKAMPEIKAVKDQLKQVFLNLIKNAAEACTEGDSITITTKAGEMEIAVSIADTGPGIAPEDIEHIFEPFFTTKPELKGTGLGLAVSYGIIKAHHGDIEVESEPGKGSVFTVHLPRNEND